MTVYDFDNTIYDGESAIDFYLYCLKRNFKLIRVLPKTLLLCILYLFKIKSGVEVKNEFYKFLKYVDITDSLLNDFWNKKSYKLKNIFKFKEGDLVISASAYFLLKPICNDLNLNLIATDIDVKTGIIIGLNCHDYNKVLLYKKKYNDRRIDNFYTDSMSDLPLINIAKKSYIVKGNKIKEYKKSV